MIMPEFLKTSEKWNKCICETNSITKFEDIFISLVEDEEIPMIDVLNIAKALEIDIEKYYKNEDLKSVLDIAEVIIHFLSIARKELYEIKHTKESTEDKQNGKD